MVLWTGVLTPNMGVLGCKGFLFGPKEKHFFEHLLFLKGTFFRILS